MHDNLCMNIDLGAKIMQEAATLDLIKVPANLQTFALKDTPSNLGEIADNSDYGLSCYVGLPQGLTNGSLFEVLTDLDIESKSTNTTRKKHGLKSYEINKFIGDAIFYMQFCSYDEKVMSNTDFPNDLRCLVYESWKPENSDFSYIMQLSGDKEHPHVKLEIDKGNPNGWKIDPKYIITLKDGVINEVKNDIEFNQETLKEVISDAQKLFYQLPSTAKGIVIEGKIMNTGYKIQGNMVIDLYEATSDINSDVGLNHFAHLDSHQY